MVAAPGDAGCALSGGTVAGLAAGASCGLRCAEGYVATSFTLSCRVAAGNGGDMDVADQNGDMKDAGSLPCQPKVCQSLSVARMHLVGASISVGAGIRSGCAIDDGEQAVTGQRAGASCGLRCAPGYSTRLPAELTSHTGESNFEVECPLFRRDGGAMAVSPAIAGLRGGAWMPTVILDTSTCVAHVCAALSLIKLNVVAAEDDAGCALSDRAVAGLVAGASCGLRCAKGHVAAQDDGGQRFEVTCVVGTGDGAEMQVSTSEGTLLPPGSPLCRHNRCAAAKLWVALEARQTGFATEAAGRTHPYCQMTENSDALRPLLSSVSSDTTCVVECPRKKYAPARFSVTCERGAADGAAAVVRGLNDGQTVAVLDNRACVARAKCRSLACDEAAPFGTRLNNAAAVNERCAGATCGQADLDLCCLARAGCESLWASCPAGYTPRQEAAGELCASSQCSPYDDVQTCCEREPAEEAYKACVQEPAPKNGYVRYPYSGVAVYGCREGFGLVGEERRVCEDGAWGGEAPKCTGSRQPSYVPSELLIVAAGEGVTWRGAEAACAQFGMTLALVVSDAQQAALLNVLPAGSGQHWVGHRSSNSTGADARWVPIVPLTCELSGCQTDDASGACIDCPFEISDVPHAPPADAVPRACAAVSKQRREAPGPTPGEQPPPPLPEGAAEGAAQEGASSHWGALPCYGTQRPAVCGPRGPQWWEVRSRSGDGYSEATTQLVRDSQPVIATSAAGCPTAIDACGVCGGDGDTCAITVVTGMTPPPKEAAALCADAEARSASRHRMKLQRQREMVSCAAYRTRAVLLACLCARALACVCPRVSVRSCARVLVSSRARGWRARARQRPPHLRPAASYAPLLSFARPRCSFFPVPASLSVPFLPLPPFVALSLT